VLDPDGATIGMPGFELERFDWQAAEPCDRRPNRKKESRPDGRLFELAAQPNLTARQDPDGVDALHGDEALARR
jgi:hypothetical protein